MRLYNLVDKVAVVVTDKQPQRDTSKNKNKSSEGMEFVMADVVVRSNAPQHTFSKSTQRTNSLFTELLNNQLRNITTGV